MSNINPYNIDGTFPVANQDNSSQGFRDNFTNIKNNFIQAQAELNDLQSKAIVTGALNGQSINNNMNGTKLTGPQLTAWTQSLYDWGVVGIGNTIKLDFTVANFQKITTGGTAGTPGTVTINFINWPSSTGQGALGYGSMRIWISIAESVHSIQLPLSVNIAAASLPNYNGAGLLSFDVPGDYIFDISSVDGGQNYLINDLTRNRAWFVDPHLYYNPTVNPAFLIGYGSFLPLAAEVESSASDTISAMGSIASYQSYQTFNPPGFGDGDSSEAGGSSVNTPGFGIVTSRSYVDPTLGPIIKATNAGDPIGYFNASFGSGSPGVIGNTSLPEAGTIRFYANSVLSSALASVPDGNGGITNNYSPGGNVQIWTKQDFGFYGAQTLGYAGWPRADTTNAGVNAIYGNQGGVLGLAMTIENDQSVKTWGATAKNYQFANLSLATNVNVSPYISTIVVDSNAGNTVTAANLLLGPSIALQDGQEINIISNCAITTVNIVPFKGNVVVPVLKYAEAVGTGSTVTYYFDNSGGYFTTGTQFTAAGFSVVSGFNGVKTVVSYDAYTANVTSTTTGTDTGTVNVTANIGGNTSIAHAPTTITAGTSTKFIYLGTVKQWYRA